MALIPNLQNTVCIFCKKKQKIPQTGSKKLQLLISEQPTYLSISNPVLGYLVLNYQSSF